jgi:hypothetical protein
LKPRTRWIQFRRSRRLWRTEIAWPILRSLWLRAESPLFPHWLPIRTRFLETRIHRARSCCRKIIAHPRAPRREPLDTKTGFRTAPLNSVTRWTRTEAVAARLHARTIRTGRLSRRSLRAITIAPWFARTGIGPALPIASRPHFIRRDAAIAIAIKLSQDFCCLVEFRRVQSAIVIGIEHPKNSRRCPMRPATRAAALARRIRWPVRRIILGAQRPRSQRERHGCDQSCSFHRLSCLDSTRRRGGRPRIHPPKRRTLAVLCAGAKNCQSAREALSCDR